MVKVICINNPQSGDRGTFYKRLIVGNIYDAKDTTGTRYIINGYWERKDNFITLSEHRDKQLKSIGLDF